MNRKKLIKSANSVEKRGHRQIRPLFKVALLIGAGLCASPALYAQTSDANADAQADSVSSSNAQSGFAEASSEASGGSAFASGGNSTVVTEINQNFEASRNPGRPEGLAPLVTSPALFRPPEGTLPGTASSILASVAYIDSCGISMGGTPTKERRQRGDSGRTDIVFLPHYNYLDRQKNPPPSAPSATGTQDDKSKQEKYTPPRVERVAVQFPKDPVQGECYGMLAVQSRGKKADSAYFFTLLNDAMEFAKNDLRGSPTINLLCGYRTIATAVGANSAGAAGSLSPGLSNLTSGFIYQGLLGGLTGSKGRTFPRAQLGVTCIVAGQGSSSIDISMLNRGGIRYDPSAITAAIQRREEQEALKMSQGNGIKEKAAVQQQLDLQPLKQQLQQGSGGSIQ